MHYKNNQSCPEKIKEPAIIRKQIPSMHYPVCPSAQINTQQVINEYNDPLSAYTNKTPPGLKQSALPKL